jgi:ArsR family transcriptional regulator, arsenate/arsenite/antimonite-responsive transcriptional repressor
MTAERIFDALASNVRRKILAYLSAAPLTAGEIATRFGITKPSLSKHLSVLENAGLIKGERKGQFIHYSLVQESLINTVNGFMQEVCPVGGPLKRESRRLAASRKGESGK